jgi:hypothetical protein
MHSRSVLRFVALAVASLLSLAAHAASCPFNVPIVTIAPHQVAGYSWGNGIRPMNDACVSSIVVEPTSDAAWYVGGFNGLYMTKTNGLTWTKPVNGNVRVLLLVPGQTQLVYAGVGNQLYLSRDKGANWTSIKTFNAPVQSLLVAGSTLYVGLAQSNHVDPSGVYTSNLGAGLMTFHPFGPGQTGLIVWTLSRNPVNGTLYAGTEIFDHPQPYHPPFFRSINNAANWTNIAGTLPWHVTSSAVRPADGYVYAQTEGLGTYGSANSGNSWIAPTTSLGLGIALLMRPNISTSLYSGRQKSGTLTGGIFLSTDSGKNYSNIGMTGVTIAGIALNGSNSRVYAAAYSSGIYTSAVP